MKTPKIHRLYRAAGICAALSALFCAVSIVVQTVFAAKSFGEFTSAEELFKSWAEHIGASDFPVYDFTALPGILLLTPFMTAFALVCFVPGRRRLTRRVAGALNGAGIAVYAGVVFTLRLALIAAVYFMSRGKGNAAYESVVRIFSNLLGQGFFELLFLSLFALSMLLTAFLGRYRSPAVSFGAICIYRLLADHARFLVKILNSSLHAAETAVLIHGVLSFAAMFLALCSAVIVAMSSPEKERGQEPS